MKKKINIKLLAGLAIFAALLLLLAGLYGCSESKAESIDVRQVVSTNDLEEDKSLIPEDFISVEESILESIRETYSASNIKVRSIELSPGNDIARITLSYPDKTSSQTVLAGFRILNDNYPKLKLYVVNAGSRTFDCDRKVLSYITSKGCSLDTDETLAIELVGNILNGIPTEDSDKPINREPV